MGIRPKPTPYSNFLTSSPPRASRARRYKSRYLIDHPGRPRRNKTREFEGDIQNTKFIIGDFAPPFLKVLFVVEIRIEAREKRPHPGTHLRDPLKGACQRLYLAEGGSPRFRVIRNFPRAKRRMTSKIPHFSEDTSIENPSQDKSSFTPNFFSLRG